MSLVVREKKMNRIRELREEKKITQIRLSIELEVSQETISAYEMEKYYPSVKSLIKLQNIFGVSIDIFLVFLIPDMSVLKPTVWPRMKHV